MLTDLIIQGYGNDEDLDCAEIILYGANKAYHLDLSHEALKMAAGFGTGMARQEVCGVLTASVMVLGKLFVHDRAHESTRIQDLTKELLDLYQKSMDSIDCASLKAKYSTEQLKCRAMILKGADILDDIVERELGKAKKS